MLSLYGDPDELDRLATELRSDADSVRQQAAAQMNRALTSHWVSVAATTYQDRLADRVAVANAAADSMDEAAAALNAHAQEVREVLARIAAIEEAARRWFGRALDEFQENGIVQGAMGIAGRVVDVLDRVLPDPPWLSWPFTPHSLPPAGDLRWLDVGAFLRGQGVHL